MGKSNCFGVLMEIHIMLKMGVKLTLLICIWYSMQIVYDEDIRNWVKMTGFLNKNSCFVQKVSP